MRCRVSAINHGEDQFQFYRYLDTSAPEALHSKLYQRMQREREEKEEKKALIRLRSVHHLSVTIHVGVPGGTEL